MVKHSIITPSFVTPVDDSRIFVFNKTNNMPVYVAEIPGCRFNGLPICLATDKKADVPKVIYMLKEFHRLWEDVASQGILGSRIG